MCARTWFKINNRSVVPKKQSARTLTLTTSAHLIVAVVSMSVRSVGGEEIQVFSPVGMARAAAIQWVLWELEIQWRNCEEKESEIR